MFHNVNNRLAINKNEKPDHLIGLKIWLPLVDALRNQFAGPSKEMMDSILVAHNQVKDGFLQTISIS